MTTCAASTGARRRGPASWSCARTRRSGSRVRVVLLDTRPGAHDEESFEAAVEATASVVARLVRSVAAGRGPHDGRAHARRHRLRPPPRDRRRDAAHGRARGGRAGRQRHPDRHRPPTAGRASAAACSSRSWDRSTVRQFDHDRRARRTGRAARARHDPSRPRVRGARVGARSSPSTARAGKFVERLGHRDDDPGPRRRPDEPVTRPARSELYAAAALAALTIAAALGLGRVFDDGLVRAPGHRRRAPPPRRRRGRARAPLVGARARAGDVRRRPPLPRVGDRARRARPTASPARRRSTCSPAGSRPGGTVFRTGHAPVPVTDGVLLALHAAHRDSRGRPPTSSRSGPRRRSRQSSRRCSSSCSRRRSGRPSSAPSTTIGYSIVALVFLMLQHQALLERHRSWASGRRIGANTTWINAAAFVGGIALLPGSSSRPRCPAPTTARCSTTRASADRRARPRATSAR